MKGSAKVLPKIQEPLRCWCLMKWFNYKEKWESRFASTIEISSVKTESNRCLHRKPDIILWSLRSFWVERFDLNQSLKIDSWRKSFLGQCTSLSQNRLFPRSRLGRMTYRKLKPHPSWHLLHAPFNPFCNLMTKSENHRNSIYFPWFSPRCCLINTFNSMKVWRTSDISSELRSKFHMLVTSRMHLLIGSSSICA